MMKRLRKPAALLLALVMALTLAAYTLTLAARADSLTNTQGKPLAADYVKTFSVAATAFRRFSCSASHRRAASPVSASMRRTPAAING